MMWRDNTSRCRLLMLAVPVVLLSLASEEVTSNRLHSNTQRQILGDEPSTDHHNNNHHHLSYVNLLHNTKSHISNSHKKHHTSNNNNKHILRDDVESSLYTNKDAENKHANHGNKKYHRKTHEGSSNERKSFYTNVDDENEPNQSNDNNLSNNRKSFYTNLEDDNERQYTSVNHDRAHHERSPSSSDGGDVEAHAPTGKHFTWKSSWQSGKKVTVLSIQPEPLRDRRSVLRRSARMRHASSRERNTDRLSRTSNKHRNNNKHSSEISASMNGEDEEVNKNEEVFDDADDEIIQKSRSHHQHTVSSTFYDDDEATGRGLTETDMRLALVEKKHNNKKSNKIKSNKQKKKNRNGVDNKELVEYLIGRARRDDGHRSAEIKSSQRIQKRRERRRLRVHKRKQKNRRRRKGRKRYSNEDAERIVTDSDGQMVNGGTDRDRNSSRKRPLEKGEGEGGGNEEEAPHRNRARSERRKQRIAERRKKRRERRERRRLIKKQGRSLDIAGLEQENKAMLVGNNACQYHDLRQCAHETQLTLAPQSSNIIPRCMQRKQFLSCMEQQRSRRGDCSISEKALGDLQALRKHIRLSMFTNSSCIIAESITG